MLSIQQEWGHVDRVVCGAIPAPCQWDLPITWSGSGSVTKYTRSVKQTPTSIKLD